MKKLDIKLLGYVMAGIFLSGLAMNAMRNNSIVKKAISGYDA